MKRLLIFSVNSDIYEESHYVIYLLSELVKYCDNVIICTSQNIEEAFYKKLYEYSEIIVKCDNYIDINRWRDVWYTYVYGQQILENIDEVIFVNDSVYGPIYSLSELFNDMEKRHIDFWGVSVHGKMKYNADVEEIPRFIQTYFWGVRKSMFKSEDFDSFMKSRGVFEDYDTASREFEFIFTDHFEKRGYKWETYIDTTECENRNCEHFMSFILFDIYRMVVNKRFPFIPKVIFDIPNSTVQTYNMGDDLYRTIEYVKENLEYDTELIYQNIIKRINLSDLINKLNLTYVLKGKKSFCNLEKKYAIFAHLFYEDLFEYSIDRLLNVPDFFDVFISTDCEEKAEKILKLCKQRSMNKSSSNVQVSIFNERGRDLSALLVCHRKEILNYDIIGFVHDKKSSQMDYITVGENFNRNIWENMLNSTEYIIEIMELLNQDERLGFLSPPMVCHGTYFHTAIDSWTICFDETLQVAELLNVDINIDRSKNPVALGSSFWCKTKALQKLFLYDFKPQDFPEEPMPVDGTFSHAIERILPYIAQEAGYYTGIIMTEDAASTRLGFYNVLMSDIMKEIKKFEDINAATCETTILSLKNLTQGKKSKIKENKNKRKKLFMKGKESRK